MITMVIMMVKFDCFFTVCFAAVNSTHQRHESQALKLVFPKQSPTDFIYIRKYVRLTAFSVCFWGKADAVEVPPNGSIKILSAWTQDREVFAIKYGEWKRLRFNSLNSSRLVTNWLTS